MSRLYVRSRDFIRREVFEELQLPKFNAGSPLSDYNLGKYREVLTGPNGRASRIVQAIRQIDTLETIVDVSQTLNCKFIARVAFSEKGSAIQGDEFGMPVVCAPRSLHGNQLRIESREGDRHDVIERISLLTTKISPQGFIDVGSEVIFPSDGGATTFEHGYSMQRDPAGIYDEVARAVKVAEKQLYYKHYL